MAAACRYEAELRETAERVARRLKIDDWALAYQSRSGRPEDPWLEPDVCDYLRSAHERGLRAAIIAPIGFVADHIEVLYDLDTEAAEVCRNLGLPMRRAAAVNDHPRVHRYPGRRGRGAPWSRLAAGARCRWRPPCRRCAWNPAPPAR